MQCQEGGESGMMREGLHNFHSLPKVIRRVKPRRTRWAGNVAYVTGDNARRNKTIRKTKM
jgi:hypothetical protein